MILGRLLLSGASRLVYRVPSYIGVLGSQRGNLEDLEDLEDLEAREDVEVREDLANGDA